MASTRYTQQPLQIFQDPVDSFDHALMPSVPNAARQRKLAPLRPAKNAASRDNMVFSPPKMGVSKQSPSKSMQHSSSSPSRAPFTNKLNSISMPPPGAPSFNTDSMAKRQPQMSNFKPQKSLFTSFSTAPADKENQPLPSTRPSYNDGFPGNNFSLEGFYGQKQPQKRTLMDSAPIHNSRNAKRLKQEEKPEKECIFDIQALPNPEAFPPLHDDGQKPSFSYAQLIGMSILRSPNRRLTLSQIYKWISDTFSHYGATDAGWQNSIRHNLSLNKAFIKQERSKDDPGKGNYWAIQPGMENMFLNKEKPKKGWMANEGIPLSMAAPLAGQPVESTQSSLKPLAAATQELPLAHPERRHPEPEISSVELSSDATIAGPDAFVSEGEDPERQPPSSPLLQSSPPTAMMHSSPPVARKQHTPPPVPRFPSSRSRSHKRKFASMDDSGYFSSLDSSAIRSQHGARLLTSEADRPVIRRGRAEEEIARLRGSSYDSPTKNRAASDFMPSSSPLRKERKQGSGQMLPPLTPAIKLRAPARPPPSVSPNTNLQLHRDTVREMVGSPLRGMTCLDDGLAPWSPAFNLDDDLLYNNIHLDLEFDIFSENPNLLFVPGNGSPEKRSAKRPRLDRSRSANILADITNSTTSKSLTSTPMLKFTPSLAPSAYDSPLKGLGLAGSPSKLLDLGPETRMGSPSFSMASFELPPDEDFLGAEFLEENGTDCSGIDLTSGFQKIGAGAPASGSPVKASSRPAMGRSITSRF